jgi:hypothetical protein
VTEFEAMVERLRYSYDRACRSGPGQFQFVTSVSGSDGPLTCVLVIAEDSADARQAAAKRLTG